MNSNAQPKPYIVAERVCKSFGTHQVLKDVSTVFHTGEVTVIIGASGSGKSTLLRAINRLEPHDSGRITIDGVDVCDDLATLQRQRCEVGMVFQQFNLFGHMSVLDNVTLAPRRIRKTPRPQANDEAMQLLRRVGMQDHAHKYPWQLSGGQQQRVAIARALAAAPAIILADEPTGNLDSKTSQDVLSLLKVTSQKFAQTIVMITHNEEIAQMADRIIRIEDGRIVSQN